MPVLLAGDEFVLNRLLAEELAAVAGAERLGRCASSSSRGRPCRSAAVAEVDEAAGTEDR